LSYTKPVSIFLVSGYRQRL